MSSDAISSEDGLSAATQTVLYSLGAFFALAAAWAAFLVGRLLWSFIPHSRHIDSQHEIASSSETDASSERHTAAKGVGMKQLLKESKSKQRGHVVTAPGSAHRLCINTLKGHADGVVGLSWSHDGSSIATASDDRAVRVFNLTDLTSRNINIKRKALLRAPVDVCFGATAGQLLVLTKGSLDAASLILLVPDAKTGAFDTIWQMESHHGGGAAISASSAWVEKANVGVILTCGTKTDLKVSSTRGVHLASIDTGGLTNHGAALSSDGRFIAAATFTVDVKIYEVSFDRSGAFQHVKKCMDLKGHNRQVRCVAFSPDCKKAVTASEDRTVKVWNLDVRYHMQEDPKLLMTIQQDKVPPSRYYTHIAFGSEGIIAASYERSLHFIDSVSSRMLEVIEDAHDGSITQLMWRPTPAVVGSEIVSVLATAGLDKRVRLWTAPRTS